MSGGCTAAGVLKRIMHACTGDGVREPLNSGRRGACLGAGRVPFRERAQPILWHGRQVRAHVPSRAAMLPWVLLTLTTPGLTHASNSLSVIVAPCSRGEGSRMKHTASDVHRPARVGPTRSAALSMGKEGH